ncbi:MAG: hypothetical protein EAZ95_17390 [Bacteroidetes bacterium]|nr:MAG: hypothetical protein EAZ95_17390 [Bacteroidota bacterium]
MKKIIPIFILVAVLGIVSFSFTPKATPPKDLELAYQYLQGHFSSEEQAKQDTAFFHITLKIAPIWKKRKGEYWLYVEQATARKPEKPYRQRVYQLKKEGKKIVSYIYTLDKPLRFAGEYAKDEPLQNLTPDSLQLKQGCEVLLSKIGKSFSGATQKQTCPSELSGAAYATSEVTLDAQKMISWDRGWDKAGKQVWGAEKGGYIFKRVK